MAKVPAHAAPATKRPPLDTRHTLVDPAKVRPKRSPGPNGDVRDPSKPVKANAAHHVLPLKRGAGDRDDSPLGRRLRKGVPD